MLLQQHSGEKLAVSQVTEKDTIVTVYNFEVEQYNCYFVQKSGVLVLCYS